MRRTRSAVEGPIDQQCRSRCGAMIVMMLFLLIVIVAMVVFTVDTAYMQLARTELRAATDAAAKAGAAALTDTGGNATAARNAAMVMAAKNRVGGRPLTLSAADIDVGRSVRQVDGTWAFMANQTPLTAVRVNSFMSSTTSAGPVNLLFGKVFNVGTFSPQRSSVASQMEQEIVLCIDRSHSMCFDESGIDWKYPRGIPALPLSLTRPPHPVHSRWASVERAINIFNDTVGMSVSPPRVALVTWGSRIDDSNFEGRYTGVHFSAVDIDQGFTSVSERLKGKVRRRSENIMLGGTNLSAGLDAAVAMFSDPGVRPLAAKVIVLMTDGEWNQGRNPKLAAQEARDAGITIHTVTFLENMAQDDMREIAEITGGRHYHASNGADLVRIFRELALSLPVTLTE